MFKLAKRLVHLLFRLFFTVEYHGIEHVPAQGAVILAGNHPSYLDPVLVLLPLKRRIRFMAWDALFKIPLMGQLIRAFGAFPVDLRKGKGEAAFQQALRVLNEGEVLGIFPEGQRSEAGPMGELRTGVARLAIATGAPIVPVTIGGASRAWPKWKLLPRAAKIIVRYHEPLTLLAAERTARGAEKEYHHEVMERVAASINRSLRPALHEAARLDAWYARPPANIRTYEWAVLLTAVIATLVAWRRGTWATHAAHIWLPVALYFFYLAADLALIKPSRLAKWVRNTLPIFFACVWHWPLTTATRIPFGERNAWLLAALLLSFFPFFYEDYYDLQKFVRGVVVSYYGSLLLSVWWPHPLGTLVAVLGFALLFCGHHRTTAWRWLSSLLALGIGSAVWLTEAPRTRLWLYGALAWVVLIYLRTFIAVAYDIRRAGTVALHHEAA